MAKGQYVFDFNIGTGDPRSGLTDFDLVYNVISFEVIYDDFESKNLIAKWATDWGYNYYKQVDIKIISHENNY